MEHNKPEYLLDNNEESSTRFISFKGDTERFDLAIISSKSLKNDFLVMDLNSNKYSKVNAATIDKANYLEHAFQYNEMEAEDFRFYVRPLLNEN
ncbi:hypothetical protein JCM21714_1901 [Gracilibacillus boraciitolerans JCM 21714]|uniref:DUF3055 family protein n=1 Tax=Gracilibacillus boraciitolerans JCM 21714 TaxID=1298598 RepID=W4VJD2_9BACI|nr:SAV0927 family protein [Gracilibacillus boraciitolerans]GAE92879.1 hypothetical protein JCM21714_1901 [Gracilibacillus boraciitolerans JCM 21714]